MQTSEEKKDKSPKQAWFLYTLDYSELALGSLGADELTGLNKDK